MKIYKAVVKDPETGQEATYERIRAVSTSHADRQARDGFTGLLGVPEGLQERLQVTIIETNL